MSSCRACQKFSPSMRCLICQQFLCLNCTNDHRHGHLLDAFEHRLNCEINQLQKQLTDKLYQQYRLAADHLHAWLDEIRVQFEKTLQSQLEKLLKNQYEILKMQTDEYAQEYVQQFESLRSNVRYAKRRTTKGDHDREILRLTTIEKSLIEQFYQHTIKFRLDTRPIDLGQFLNVEKVFHESIPTTSFQFDYTFDQPSYTLNLSSRIQHIASSCLDLFVFVTESSPSGYSRLLEYSTSSSPSKVALEHSIDFPLHTPIIDMCWSTPLDCLLLLTPTSLHKYDKYYQKIQANILELSDRTKLWHRLTTNRFGIYILNETNSLESYDHQFHLNAVFYLKDLIEQCKLVYDLQGQTDRLCTLTYSLENTWQIDLFIGKQLDYERTFKFNETFRLPLKLISANRRNMWILIDSEKHRLILFDNQIKTVEHFPLSMIANDMAILDDRTVIVVSSNVKKGRISFYSNENK